MAILQQKPVTPVEGSILKTKLNFLKNALRNHSHPVFIEKKAEIHTAELQAGVVVVVTNAFIER